MSMVTTSDIGNIIYKFCSTLSVNDVRRGWNFQKGEVTTECVTISVKTITSGRTWSKAYAEVNVCVPDLPDGEADLIRLGELECEYVSAFGRSTGVLDGVRWRFSRESFGMLDDAQLRLHYVNVRVLFEFQNLMSQWQTRFQQ